ncbi:hypothetical protein WA026_015786 [Henosepilachna vigintioctopunctata]|uniref:Uncharacterized protein n=1 Tax=Henosepilachna vigintioctopunctata TaxID=420089 RepID=A0AAW1UYP3_9CUCU
MSLYSSVLFVDDKGPNNVDIVPTDWIFYEKKDNHLHCPFIDDNPTTEESEYLRNLVINRDNPNENWNFHRLDVRGVADSYDEAIEKLSILKRKTHAFSTDNEDKVKQRQEEIKEKCRLKGKQKIDVKERLKSSYLDLSKPANEEKQKKKKHAKSSSDEDDSKKSSDASDYSSSFESQSSNTRQQSTFSPSNIIDEECTAVLDSLPEDDGSRNNGELENSAIVSKSQPSDTRQQSRSKLEDQPNRDKLKKNSTQPATCQSYTKASMKSYHRTERERYCLGADEHGKNLIQNLTAVLSKFFTANAINQFTAIKPTGEKGVFKDTQFSSYLLRILRDDLGSCGVTFKDKEYFDGIGRVINNAKTWST